MTNSSKRHGLQYDRLPCLSRSLGVCSNSCPLSQWCHTTISSSVTPFSSCPQSFPASETFPVSRFFASDDHSIGASALASMLPGSVSILLFSSVVHSLFGTRDWFCGKQFFHIPGIGVGNSFRMIQMHYIYCALYFYYYYVTSASDHQALDPEDWDP